MMRKNVGGKLIVARKNTGGSIKFVSHDLTDVLSVVQRNCDLHCSLMGNKQLRHVLFYFYSKLSFRSPGDHSHKKRIVWKHGPN